MAKRKRSANFPNASRKKAKVPHAHGEIVPGRLYKLRSIVGEDETRYLISWEDDEVTGEKFEDTWEPKRNANRQAREDWERQKAEKKRLEKLAGRPSKSRSTSVSSTAQQTTKSHRKDKTEIGIESSPPPVVESSQSNGHFEENHSQSNELIEIRESDEEGNPGSPLFEPQRLAVQPSPPPSSYLAGGYQKAPSSEPVFVGTSQTKGSPEPSSDPVSASSSPTEGSAEPSQYLPDPVDTSKSTEDITEKSLAPSTPPESAHPVPVEFVGSSTVKVVPDSQVAFGSSSYRPSATATVSSSAPEPLRAAESSKLRYSTAVRTSPERLVPSTSIPLQTEQELPVTKSPLSDSSPVESGDIATETNEVDQALPAEVPQSTAEKPLADEAAETPPEDERARHERIQSPTVGQEASEDLRDPLHDSQPLSTDQNLFHTSQERDVEIPREQIAEEATSLVNPKAVFGPRNGTISVQHQLRNSHPEVADREHASHHKNSQYAESSTESESQRNGESQQSLTNHRNFEIGDQRKRGVVPEPSNFLSQSYYNGSAAARIDLTTTQHQALSIDSFAVTSPAQAPTAAFGIDSRLYSPQALFSSARQSSFLFQTQPPGTSAVKAHSNTASSKTNVQSQQVFGNRSPLRDTPRFSPRPSTLPHSQSSPLSTSSSIFPAPSQSIEIGTSGGSAPAPALLNLSSPRQSPNTNRTMERSYSLSKEGKSLTEQLAEMRAQTKLEIARRSLRPGSSHPNEAPAASLPISSAPVSSHQVQRAVPPKLASPFLLADERTRSPSVVPAMEPLATITQEEMNTSRRVKTLLPQSQQDVSDDALPNGTVVPDITVGSQTTTKRDPELAGAHVVPVYLLGHHRDQYSQRVHYSKDMIQRFLASKSPDEKLVLEAKQFVDRMRRITLHPDLDDEETFTQYDVQPSQQVKWHTTFAKFHFLEQLLNGLRNSALHVAIVAEEGSIMNILEVFLRGLGVSYYRQRTTDSISSEERRESLMVSLLASGASDASIVPADLVIGMQNSVKHDSEQIRALRQAAGRWSPLITLVVPYTVEHIERCLSPALPDRTWTRALVSGIYQYRDKAGRPQWGENVPKDTARLLAEYLTSAESGAEWPFPGLINLDDLDSQTESEIDTNVGNADRSNFAIVGEKRLRRPSEDDVGVADSSKRSRVESPASEQGPVMPTTMNFQDVDVTHISDSIEKTTQDVEAGSPVLNSNEKRLQDLLRDTQDRLEEHVKVLSGLQYRYEEQRSKLIEVTTERDEAITTAQTAVARLGEESNKMSNLRAELTAAKDRLKEANTNLLDHSVPERAAFEALRLEAAQAKTDKEKLERRLEQANKDVAYVRDLYQNSSNSAQSLAAQVSDLENQLAVAQNKATGEQAKLRQLSHDALTINLQSENKKLKARLKDCEVGLKFRDEEIAKLKEASRGRMGTRGTSVPRSPRMGSRQTSPAAGELRGRVGLLHPLRNTEV